MRETSDIFWSLWTSEHIVETMVDIASVQYDSTEILSRRIYGGVSEKPDIGTCSSRTLELSIIPKASIPRGAEIIVSARLRSGQTVSEWIPQGTFYISERIQDKKTGRIDITAYDAMRKANAVWLNSTYNTVNFPISESDAVTDIANRIGVAVDSRTTLDNVFPIEYPVDENGDMTMWSILACIGVANAGSWVISEENKLRLLRIGDIPAETSNLVDEYGRAIEIGGVLINVE